MSPLVLGLGQEAYSCREVFHHNKTCYQFLTNKFKESMIKGLKLYFIAYFTPYLIRKRKELSSMELKKVLTVIKDATTQCIRGALFVCLANSVPFTFLCCYPFSSRLIRGLSIRKKVPMFFTSIVALALIVEAPSRIPAYMGFMVAKALSQIYKLSQYHDYIPALPFENVLSMALIAAISAYVSVKKSLMEKQNLERAQKAPSEEKG